MCNVSVDSARASQVTGNTINEITVSGTVSDCAPLYSPNPDTPPSVQIVVDATAIVSGNEVAATATATLQVSEENNEQRPWSTTLKGFPDLPCGIVITVKAKCETNEECNDEQPFTINCQCPTVRFTKNEAEQQECNINNDREVTFTVALNNLSPSTTFVATLHTGHQINNNEFTETVLFQPSDLMGTGDWTQQANGEWQKTFSHLYTGGLYSNVRLSVISPSECAGEYLIADGVENGIVNVANCSSGDCPESISFSVIHVASDDDVTSLVNDDQCLEQGLYKISVTEPNNSGSSYTWSVNNTVLNDDISDTNDPNFPNVSGINRSSYNHQLSPSANDTISVAIVNGDCTTTGATTLTQCNTPDDGGGITIPDPRPDRQPTPEPMPILCKLLMLLALFILFAGLGFVLYGACTGDYGTAVAGGIAAIAGAGLLITWALLCLGYRAGCSTLQNLLEILMLVELVLATIWAVLGIITIFVEVTLPCWLGFTADTTILGVLITILWIVFAQLGCQIRRPTLIDRILGTGSD